MGDVNPYLMTLFCSFISYFDVGETKITIKFKLDYYTLSNTSEFCYVQEPLRFR